MERLTKRIDRSVYYTKGKYEETLPSECEIRDVRNILYRLAAYEDTGLEPKEVRLISNVLEEVGETYNCRFHYVVKCVTEAALLRKLAQGG